MQVSPNNLAEDLDQSKNFGDVFQLVKRAVKETLGLTRAGLMLYIGNLPTQVGAFHQLGSNGIVINRKILNRVERDAKSKTEVHSFLFVILTHEYLHSLGYHDEQQVRELVREISEKVLGEKHPATEMATTGLMQWFPGKELPHDQDVGDFTIIRDFERQNQTYIS
jgi:hypothetical protein